MHLQNSSKSITVQSTISLWNILERIKDTLNLTDHELAEALELTPKSYLRLKKRQINPSAHSIMNLANHFNVSIDHLISGKIDFRILAAQAKGNHNFLSERYSVATFSRKRTSINLLSYLETFYGWKLKSRILRHFQMSETCFSNPDEWINVRFLEDLCLYLIKEGFTEEQLFHMGSFALVSNYNSKLGKAYRQLSSPKEIVERSFGDLVELYDKNIKYKLKKVTNDFALLDAKSNPEVAEALRTHEVGNVYYCKVKSGVFSSLPGYIGLPFANVEEQSCVHRGDYTCRYKIDYSKANWINSKKLCS